MSTRQENLFFDVNGKGVKGLLHVQYMYVNITLEKKE